MMQNRINSWPDSLNQHATVINCQRARHAAALLPASLSSAAWAQVASSEVPAISTATLLQTMLGLALVIAFFLLAAYLLRRINGGRGFGSNGPLRIVGGLVIGPRERIVLVEIADSWIVVGLVPGQIRTLHTLPKGELGTGSDGQRHFAQWLKQISERKNEDG